jgi:hypothetical protein
MPCDSPALKSNTRFRHMLPNWPFVLALLILGVGWPSTILAQTSSLMASREKVDVNVIPAQREVRPGADLPVAVVLDHETGWHTNPHQLQVLAELGNAANYIATQIKADNAKETPLKARADFIQWPDSETVQVNFTRDCPRRERFLTFAPSSPPQHSPYPNPCPKMKPVS